MRGALVRPDFALSLAFSGGDDYANGRFMFDTDGGLPSMSFWRSRSSTTIFRTAGTSPFAEGMVNTGPTPQMSAPGCAGEKNSDCVMSPIPFVLLSNNGLGWLMTVIMVREIMFQSGLMCSGTTGCMFKTSCVRYERSGVKICVTLERNTDEISNRILRFLC
jgi:hypothetical protein